MKGLVEDLRFGVRMLIKTRGFTAACLITVALGVGVNTTIFSFVDALWLRPLAVEKPEELVRIFTSDPKLKVLQGSTSYPDYLDLRERSRTLSGIVLSQRRGVIFKYGSDASGLLTNVVSPNYFSFLGVKPFIGRTFDDHELEGDGIPSVLLSYTFWRDHFAGDPGILSRTILLNNRDCVVLGVLPKQFRGTDSRFNPPIWISLPAWLQLNPWDREYIFTRSSRAFEVLGRLRPGTDLDAVGRELNVIAAQLERAYPETNETRKITVEFESKSKGAGLGLILLSIAALVLLIACVNLVNLFIARLESRKQEFATRLALGASHKRIVRQFLSETFLLCLLGAFFALSLSVALLDLLTSSIPPVVPVDFDVRFDTRVITFTAGVTLLVLTISGLFLILKVPQIASAQILRAQAEGAMRLGRGRLRSILIVAQVAVSLPVGVAAGLLTRTYVEAQRVDPGFDPHRQVLLVDLLPADDNQDRRVFYRQVLERASGLPAVRASALTRRVPLSPSGGGATLAVFISGWETEAGLDGIPIRYTSISPGYFEAMGTQLERGRSFGNEDHESAPKVAIVNRTMARRFWPDGEAVGKWVRIGKSGPQCEIGGGVQDGKYLGLTEDPLPYMFVPLSQHPSGEVTLIIATAHDPRGLAAPVRESLRQWDRNLTILGMRTMDQHMHYALYGQSLTAGLVGGLGALAWALAGVGLYGLVSYVVSRRAREIGIRVALGTRPADVFRSTVGQGMSLVAIGAAIGLAGSLALTRFLRSLLFNVSPTDPLTFAIVLILLAMLSFLACFIPARRATRVDPMAVLRQE